MSGAVPKRVKGGEPASIPANQPASSLKQGGGGGTFDGMEARVSVLEALAKSTNDKLDKLLDKMGKVEVDVARIDALSDNMKKVEASVSRLELKLETSVARLENKIETSEKKLEANIARVENKLDSSIARVESKIGADVARLDEKVSQVVADIARVDGRVSTLPTTLHLLGFVLAVLTMAGLAKYFTP